MGRVAGFSDARRSIALFRDPGCGRPGSGTAILFVTVPALFPPPIRSSSRGVAAQG